MAGMCLLSGLVGAVVANGMRPAPAASASAGPEARVQRVEDELAIRRILIEYGKNLDNRDYRAYSQLFARQGQLHSGVGTAVGPDGIYTMLTKVMPPAWDEPHEAHATLHLMTNPIIDITGDEATVLSKYTFIVTGEDGRPRPQIAAHYRDRMVREDGVWKIAERTSHADILPPNPTGGQGGGK
jgi:hypothetical protein